MRGLQHDWEIVGLSDYDLHPRYLAEQYVAEDRQVMQSGRPLPNQVWLVPSEGGELKWYLSSKIPLFGRDGQVIGIAGVMRDLQKFETVYRPYQAMDEVLRHVLRHFGQRLDVPELAAMVHLSVSQFNRRFKALFQMTPQQYILRVRVNAACQMLTSRQQNIAEIAQDCGFYDQSYFTKQFRRHTGTSPLAYRNRYPSA
jgi:AraC-like DNA-binding protein